MFQACQKGTPHKLMPTELGTFAEVANVMSSAYFMSVR